MSIKHYSWNIIKLETSPELNFQGAWFQESVRVVHWHRMIKGPDERECKFVGKTKLSSLDTDQNDYIPYGDLYNEHVTQWVSDSLSEKELSEIDRRLLIEYNRAPREVQKVPW